MAVWAGMGQAATVAQLIGVDAVGLISMILQAAETACDNRKECEQLARRVSMIADLLPQLQLDQDVMTRPLAGLDDSLREAHELVLSCQGRSPAYRFFMAGRQARRFRDVQSRIDSYLLVFPVVSHIAIVRRLDRICHVEHSNHAVQHGAEEEFTLPEITPSPANNNNVAFDTTLCAAMACTGTACEGSSRLHDGREVAVLSPLRLKHIVHLSRWRVEKEKRQVVSEYVNNGTLRHHLHSDGGGGRPSSSPSPVMASWRMRVEVLLGVSRAVAHLHRSAVLPVVRRDVNSCNILLDASWTPHVSDLRASWRGTNVQGMDDGTVRHLVPAVECYRTGRHKPASDVYNLGVVMLEVLTGKRPMVTNWDEQKKSEVAMSLVCFALPFIDAGQLAEVLDRRPPVPEPTLRQLAALEQVAQAAARCLRQEVEDRPPISDVVAHLERALKRMCSERMFRA